MSTATQILLGPQRPIVNLGEAIAEAGFEAGSLAVISAAWQEAENDIDDVRHAVGLPLVDLELYRRAEALITGDASIGDAYRARQDRLRQQQRLYRLRLQQLATAAREMLRAEGDHDMIATEQRHAVAQLRALDRHHLQCVEAIHGDFETHYSASTVPDIARHVHELRELLAKTDGLLVTGGNIIVLLNRMRLFGMRELIGDKPIIGWSAGAMVLAKRIVLFHDRMPQGEREPELLGAGLGVVPGCVIFPDPAQRLREAEKLRAGLMSRRFAPDTCVTLDSGAFVEMRDGRVVRASEARRIGRTGRFTKVKAA